MIPDVKDYLHQDFTYKSTPGKTYRLDPKTGVVKGTVDGLEAVKQAIFLILSTERTEYEIYSWNYGVEVKNLIGLPVDLVCARIENTITDALMQDDRITSVADFSFSVEKEKVNVTFAVGTSEGDIETGWTFDV